MAGCSWGARASLPASAIGTGEAWGSMDHSGAVYGFFHLRFCILNVVSWLFSLSWEYRALCNLLG